MQGKHSIHESSIRPYRLKQMRAPKHIDRDGVAGVGAERTTAERQVAGIGCNRRAVFQIPEPHGAILTRRECVAPIGGDGEAPDGALMPGQRPEGRAGAQIPDADDSSGAGRHRTQAGAAQCAAIDPQAVPAQFERFRRRIGQIPVAQGKTRVGWAAFLGLRAFGAVLQIGQGVRFRGGGDEQARFRSANDEQAPARLARRGACF